MNELTKLIRGDMKPALGVTEPGAIAFAVSKARSYVGGKIASVDLTLNSGMYKNAFTCGIPGSNFCGNEFAAALGVLAGDPDKGLECLANVTDMDNALAEMMVKTGRIRVHMSEITSRIFIEARVKAEEGEAVVTIRDAHTNIVNIQVNGETIFSGEEESGEHGGDHPADIHSYTLQQIYDYAVSVPAEEIAFIQEAYEMNGKLFEEGIHSERTTYARYLLEQNGGEIISDDEQKTASLLCNAAIEARVIGLDSPAMSITGSGAHGIIATMPGEAISPMWRMVSSGVFPLMPWMESMLMPCMAKSTERKAASTATIPFMVQPWLPPSQIMPVMLLAMLLMVRVISSTPPPFKYTRPQAIPVPAAMPQPQKAESLPEYSLIYMHTR